jgi:hypothetical protein
MIESFRALCSDYYVNQKLSLKLDLPKDRQTILDLFDRVRREYPGMDQFRRYRDELALESNAGETRHRWVAIRSGSVRSGSVNPDSLEEAYRFHGHLLEVCPYFLTISPLDVDCLEVLFGFDLLAGGNHDQIVFDALIAGSSLGQLLDVPGTSPIDCQPVLGMVLREPGNIEAHFEVKTRSPSRGGKPDHAVEPISIYLTLRKYGPVGDVKHLGAALQTLGDRAEELVESRVFPNLIVPIRNAIGMSNGAPD